MKIRLSLSGGAASKYIIVECDECECKMQPENDSGVVLVHPSTYEEGGLFKVKTKTIDCKNAGKRIANPLIIEVKEL